MLMALFRVGFYVEEGVLGAGNKNATVTAHDDALCALRDTGSHAARRRDRRDASDDRYDGRRDFH